MNHRKFVMNIEGDYVDSYIYSGYLVLVDSEYKLTIYKWEKLFDESIFINGSPQSLLLRELIKDSRKPIPKNCLKEISLSKDVLKKAKICSFDIGVWPTDLNIYSNKIYISSESGVSRMDLNYDSGELGNETKIFDEMCFSLSPNSHGRLAFAAGKEGVFTLIPLSNFFSPSDVKQLIPDVCIDLDWQATKLLASTNNGVVEASFSKMPQIDNYKNKNDFFCAVKNHKTISPQIITKNNVNCAWIAGDKIYSLNNNNTININSEDLAITKTISIEGRLLRARTAAFGTVIESDNSLVALIGDDKVNMASDPVSWRVFPRAKNYANQLHIINDDYISIMVIESKENNDFGFDTEKIDLIG